MNDKLSQKNAGGTVDDRVLDPVVEAVSKNRTDPQEEDTIEGEIEEEDRTAEFEKQAETFSEKKIRNMLKAPFELAYVFTGIQEVRLTEDEINLLLEDTVDVLNYFVKVNPIYLAVFGLVVNGGAITMSKINAVRKAKAKPVDEKKGQP